MQFIPMGRPSDRLMWITPDRVFYVGLLGAPSVRTMGAVMAYVATQGSIRVSIDGGEWQTTQWTARLRIALSAAHTEGDIARLVNDLAELAPTPAPTEINAPFPVNA